MEVNKQRSHFVYCKQWVTEEVSDFDNFALDENTEDNDTEVILDGQSDESDLGKSQKDIDLEELRSITTFIHHWSFCLRS